MPEHLHFVSRLHPKLELPQFMNGFKSITAKNLRPMLAPSVEARFSQQYGLGRRTFWQRSYRGFEITTHEELWQKLDYIHRNPVRRGLVEAPHDYQWSSAKFLEDGDWTEELGM